MARPTSRSDGWPAETAPEYPQASYYSARYYDPAVGRFIGEDPLSFLGGTNRYEYVENRPTNFRDSLGLCPDPDCVRRAWGKFDDAGGEIDRKIMWKPLKGAVSGAVWGCLVDVETGCLPAAGGGAIFGFWGGLAWGVLDASYVNFAESWKAYKQLKIDLAACEK